MPVPCKRTEPFVQALQGIQAALHEEDEPPSRQCSAGTSRFTERSMGCLYLMVCDFERNGFPEGRQFRLLVLARGLFQVARGGVCHAAYTFHGLDLPVRIVPSNKRALFGDCRLVDLDFCRVFGTVFGLRQAGDLDRSVEVDAHYVLPDPGLDPVVRLRLGNGTIVEHRSMRPLPCRWSILPLCVCRPVSACRYMH